MLENIILFIMLIAITVYQIRKNKMLNDKIMANEVNINIVKRTLK